MTYREAMEEAAEILRSAGVPEANLDARLLLEYVCGTDRNYLYLHGEEALLPESHEKYRQAVQKRAGRIPLQHITGVQNFLGLDFKVNESVLIPRQDTEVLAEEALVFLNDGDRLLDMCTGSGCLLLSVMSYKNDIKGWGADISEAALEVAGENYERLKSRINGEAAFIKSDLFDKISGKYDMIVSNPPYIESDEIEGLMPEVRDYDPRLALDGGMDGLDFYKRITGEAPGYLTAEGMLLVEIGCNQAEGVSELFEKNGFRDITVIKDLSGLDRVVRGMRGQ